MHYIYLLKDQNKQQMYIGYTNNLERRMKDHEKSKQPEVIYFEAYKSDSSYVSSALI